MGFAGFVSTALVAATLLTRANTAHAQQAFEVKFVAARTTAGELVSLPTIGIVPANTVPLDSNVADELKEAVQRQLAAANETRFEVTTRANGAKLNWAFVVRNDPRSAHDAFTTQFQGQLLTCLHSLEDNVGLASLNLLLLGSPVPDQASRDAAISTGAQMLVNWKTDHCVTQRNSIAFLDDDAHRTKRIAATRGMLTDEFDPLQFNGQALLDLISALKPVFFSDGGFWTTEMTQPLRTLFEAAVRNGLPLQDELVNDEQRTFWDWAISTVISEPTVVRSFLANAAIGCVRTVPELSNRFQLSRCVTDGKLLIELLTVAGQNFVTIQRVVP
jgi:hypothetical protein